MSRSTRPGASARPLALAAGLAALFLFSALIGVWTAYDRAGAWQAAALLAVGMAAAVAVVWAGRRWGEPALAAMSLAVVLLAGALGVYFLLSYSWSDSDGKLGLLQEVGLAVQALRPALPLPEDINANVAANGLLLTLFIGLGGVLWAIRRRRWTTLVLAGLAWTAGLVALALTQSRGAWLSALVGVAAMAYLALRRRLADRRNLRIALDLLALAAVLAPAVFFWAAVQRPEIAQWLGSPVAGASAAGRAVLWRDGLDLAADYPFTGSGLRSTMMVYSTYGLLLHVGYIPHMHNLLLQITIEQGALAVLAFAGLLAAAAGNVLAATGPRRPDWRFGLAAGGALAAQAAHGLIDAGVYASLAAPLLFLPAGFALALNPGRRRARGRLSDWPLVAALVAVAALAAVVFLPTGRAALLANLGAVAQTRAELAAYTWPQWPIQDALRRSDAIDLGPAIARYEAALATDPDNPTANRRLGQIELARGEYAAARAHLEAAYAAAPQRRATRQLLGELAAIDGETARAAELLDSVDMELGQLDLRVYWYTHIGEEERAERLRAAAGL